MDLFLLPSMSILSKDTIKREQYKTNKFVFVGKLLAARLTASTIGGAHIETNK